MGLAREMGRTVVEAAEAGRSRQLQAETKAGGGEFPKAGHYQAVPSLGWAALRGCWLQADITPSIQPRARASRELLTEEPGS